MRYLAIVTLLLLGGCSVKSLYPGLGATAGAATGSLAGPAGSAGGALLGWSVGEAIKSEEKVDEVVETLVAVEALSKGDVSRLLEAQESTFDKVIDGIYDTIIICCIVAALWFLVPVLWTKYHVRKKIEDHLGK
jgi:hypothetical protein